MNREQFWFTSADQLEIAAYRWPAHSPASAIVQISHGMAERAQRYDHVAASLNGAGFRVYANDHRGHGLSGTRSNSIGDFGTAGWNGLVDDRSALTRIARELEHALPVILRSQHGFDCGPAIHHRAQSGHCRRRAFRIGRDRFARNQFDNRTAT